ncbi:DNA-binding protein [Marasmius fiardii PR-910]|nr:DNA-binding protein [Marasmius fiardii PR-910]
MQAQITRPEQAITSAQSIAVVQTLLRAGLGCITFMRELLPQDNFVESHFTTAEDGRSYSSSSFTTPDGNKRNVSGFKIMVGNHSAMNLSRGYTHEADRLLNYLENGIFDALQKQYLRSFIFAIYVDKNNPNNIIEAYTFNFRYHTIAGTNTTIPIMTLGDDLNKMSLQDRSSDPLIASANKGKPPTLKDVKKSVKGLLKSLISAMVNMDVLPKRRYASFKIFYTDDTPPEYEPPHFRPGNYEKDKWHFTTHDFDEIPEKWSLGRVSSGYHSVEVNVSTIATYLPSSTEHEDALFTGITSARPDNTATPAEEAARRAEQTQRQLEDAKKRNVVWTAEDAEDNDPDGDCDSDPEYKPTPPDAPIGIRTADGIIEPIPEGVDLNGMNVDEAQVFGATQTIPTRLHEILDKKASEDEVIPETQSVQTTQEVVAQSSGLPSSDVPGDDDYSILDTPTPMMRGRSSFRRLVRTPSSSLSSIEDACETQIVTDSGKMNDTEMLDLETQPLDIAATQTVDTIESFGQNNEHDMARKEPITTKEDNGPIECECGITEDKEIILCEGGCNRWYHIWCMGYHFTQDPRLPQSFTCFDCCIHADPSWELIKVDLYPAMILKFRELAIFRRAIKVAEKEDPTTIAEFAKHMGIISFFIPSSFLLNGLDSGCRVTEARQLFKRLETEGFILEQTTMVNDIGIAETRTRDAKNKGKTKQGQRRNVQKPKYAFNRQSVQTQAYKDYFNPNREVESKLLGLAQKLLIPYHNLTMQKATIKSRKIRIPDSAPVQSIPQDDVQTQTQDETQLFTTPEPQKRFAENDDNLRPKKKPKISLAPPVDLAE